MQWLVRLLDSIVRRRRIEIVIEKMRHKTRPWIVDHPVEHTSRVSILVLVVCLKHGTMSFIHCEVRLLIEVLVDSRVAVAIYQRLAEALKGMPVTSLLSYVEQDFLLVLNRFVNVVRCQDVRQR